jgi:peptide/nickel transport system permease protein
MARFIVRRLVGMVFVLFAISVIVFLIFVVLPANPAAQIAGKNRTPTLIKSVEEEFGFNKSIPEQYVTTMKKIVTGELVSYSSAHEKVDQRILEGIPATFSLCLGAVVIWMFFGLLFGYISAIRAGRFADISLTILALIGISMPIFWLASIFLYYLTFKVEIFPANGYVPFGEDPLEWANHLILPWITLAVLYIGFYSRVLRSNMLDVMHEDYVRTARAKGLSERRVMVRHVLRNSLIPIITLFGLDTGALIGGGAIVTETLYGLQGVGQYAGEAIGQQDLPPIMAVVLFGAFFIVLFNAIVDIAYAYLDPRIRLGEAAQ